MKKKYLLATIALAMSFSLCACKTQNNDKNNDNTPDISDEITNLQVPIISLTNTSNDNQINIVASWNKIDHADKYIVYIDDNEVSTITSINEIYSYVCPNVSGKHTISVKAISNNENISSSSSLVNYSILDSVNIKIDNATNIITWDKINGATGYKIYVNDELKATLNDNSYSLDFDKYSNNDVSIIAYSNVPLNFSSCYSFKLDYTDMGYVSRTIKNFDEYENSTSHVKVKTLTELIDAIERAKFHYTSTITSVIGDAYTVRSNVEKNETNWNNALNAGLYLKETDGSYTQIPVGTPYPDKKTNRTYYEKSSLLKATYTQDVASGYTLDNFKGDVRVIEIENDIDLGFNHLPSEYQQKKSIIESWGNAKKDPIFTKSSMYEENGISKIKIENTNDLLIMSRNGSKLTHGGFSVQSCDNVVFRNLNMDEMWQWEDSSSTSTSALGDYDAYGWAYFKIGFCGSVWIDHCTFGKSFDGQIDISNPTYNTKGTVFRAPYGATGESLVQISNCKFLAGSDDKNGYLYKMMKMVEDDYNNTKTTGTCKYQYYKALRDGGLSFEDILYGIAIPQKKAFLDGDSGDEYIYNTNLRVSIGNCYFRNIEDRLPKVRSGVAYVYNSVFDNFEYYSYRTKLKVKNAADLVSNVNSSWKCGLVSQGIVCGNGGSVYSINCIYNGILELLKNNDRNNLTNNANDPSATSNGGYMLINCRYQLTEDDKIKTTGFPNSTPATLNENYFKWRDNDNNKPFICRNVSLDTLKSDLILNSGASNSNQNWFIKY